MRREPLNAIAKYAVARWSTPDRRSVTGRVPVTPCGCRGGDDERRARRIRNGAQRAWHQQRRSWTNDSYNAFMRGGNFDEVSFFGAVHESGARALLIGRRALVLLGLPVLTADYDFWLAIDDIGPFNAAAARCDLHPTVDPERARQRG